MLTSGLLASISTPEEQERERERGGTKGREQEEGKSEGREGGVHYLVKGYHIFKHLRVGTSSILLAALFTKLTIYAAT